MRALIWTAALTLAFDQALKWAVVVGLNLREIGQIEVWPPFLTLTMAWNRGVNFGLFADDSLWLRAALVALPLIVSAWVWHWVRGIRGGWALQLSAGLLIGGALMAFVIIYARWKGYGKGDYDGRLPFLVATRRAAFALLMPVVILGGIYGGVFTPTEASVVAVFYALIVGVLIYRETKIRDLPRVLRKSVISSAVILFIIANAGLFSYLITRAGVPTLIGAYLVEVLQSPALFLLGVNAALFVIGMFIETSASIIVLAPILAPVAAHFGIDPVHFGIIMVVNLALGMITPPFGVNLFAACTVARISLDQIVTRLIPFVLVVLGCLLVITYVPVLSIGLRDLVYK